jgi:hypothetical protein
MNNVNVTSTQVFVDAKKAKQFLKKIVSCQRDGRPRLVSQLKKLMLTVDPVNGDRKFKNNLSPLKFDSNGNMFDGYHRCTAVIEADKDEPGIGFWFFVESGHEPSTVQFVDNLSAKRNLFDDLSYRVSTKDKKKFYQQLCADVEKMFGGIGTVINNLHSSEKVDFLIKNEQILGETNKIFKISENESTHGFNEPVYRAAFHSYIVEDPTNISMYHKFAKMLVGDEPTTRKDAIEALKKKIPELEKEHEKLGSRVHGHTRMALTLQAIQDQIDGIDASKKTYQLKPAGFHKFSGTKYSLGKDKE